LLAPSKFYSYEAFKRQWVETYWQGNILKEGGIKQIARFKEYTKDISIRRERTEVMPELPLVNRTKLFVQMDATAEKIYDEAVDDFVRWYEEQVGELTGMAIIAAMQKMRHLVALAKIPATVEYVSEFIEETDRKLVIFAHHKDVQQFLYDKVAELGAEENIPVLRLTADMSGQARYDTQERFNESKRAILIASQLAAGEGLNLQTCCDCVMHERQWNPGNEEQCEGRFIRIGQVSASVNAIYAHLDGLTTIDPQLDGIVERKRVAFCNWADSTPPSWSEDNIMKELAEVIVRAHKQKRAA
jgi:SNF2 family DNA or RNA helicase